MDEFLPRVQSFFRENLLATFCFGIGLIFLVYGLIAFLGLGQSSNVIFESSAAAQDESGKKEKEAGGQIVVDVSGAVKKPGVYRLSQKARIEDALLAAGGVDEAADHEYIAKNVNLASVLTDGAKVYLPFLGEGVLGEAVAPVLGTSSTGNISQNSSGININSASSSELEDLPGIGEVTAGKIISARPYVSVDELIKKKVVSQKVYEQIKEKVSVF